MAKPKDLAEPILDSRIEFVEFACEEVIDPLHDHQMIFARQSGNQRPDFLKKEKSALLTGIPKPIK